MKTIETVKYYIIFYKYEDTKTWHHSGLSLNEEELRQSIIERPYVDQNSLIVKEIELPN